jgi:hypothetical protein
MVINAYSKMVKITDLSKQFPAQILKVKSTSILKEMAKRCCDIDNNQYPKWSALL